MQQQRKTAAEISGDGPELVQQPNGGALLSGGVKGNKGGTGRPPSVLKERRDEFFASLLDMDAGTETEETVADALKRIIKEATTGDKPDMPTVRWLAEMTYGGIRSKVSYELDDTDLLNKVMAVAAEMMAPDQFEAFAHRLQGEFAE